jgi:uncharacterized protein YciI
MPLFTVIGFDHPPHSMETRDKFRAEHREYVWGNDQRIQLVGPFLDAAGNQCGSFYIFEADSEEEVRTWLASEPFVKAGVYRDIFIRRFVVGMNRFAPQDWPRAAKSS